MQNKFTLSVKPIWDEIEHVRNKCSDFLKSHKLSGSAIDALIMVVSELMENAVKYGAYPSDSDMVQLSITKEKNIIIVEVKNPINDTIVPYLRHLDETIQWIRGYQDPFETYIIKLRQISTKPLQDTESGLGLVRISYEGQSILDFFVSDDKFLNISAVYKY